MDSGLASLESSESAFINTDSDTPTPIPLSLPMPLRIYQMAHSPFCLPLTRALGAHGVSFETIEVPNHDRRLVIEASAGASYQVPLLDDHGTIVWEDGPDSQRIPRHLDRVYCRGNLFPAASEGLQGLLLPLLENEVEGITFRLCDIHYIPSIPDLVARTMVIRHKERKFGPGCVDRWRDQKAALGAEAVRALTPWSRVLENQAWLCGPQPVYADYLLWGILGNLTWKGWNPLPPLPPLVAWHQRMSTYTA